MFVDIEELIVSHKIYRFQSELGFILMSSFLSNKSSKIWNHDIHFFLSHLFQFDCAMSLSSYHLNKHIKLPGFYQYTCRSDMFVQDFMLDSMNWIKFQLGWFCKIFNSLALGPVLLRKAIKIICWFLWFSTSINSTIRILINK